jgi:TatD DNase family protein
MVETDCPYLTPEPHRGKRNEPLYVEFVAREVARVKNEPLEEIEKITTENAIRLFSKIEK